MGPVGPPLFCDCGRGGRLGPSAAASRCGGQLLAVVRKSPRVAVAGFRGGLGVAARSQPLAHHQLRRDLGPGIVESLGDGRDRGGRRRSPLVATGSGSPDRGRFLDRQCTTLDVPAGKSIASRRGPGNRDRTAPATSAGQRNCRVDHGRPKLCLHHRYHFSGGGDPQLGSRFRYGAADRCDPQSSNHALGTGTGSPRAVYLHGPHGVCVAAPVVAAVAQPC